MEDILTDHLPEVIESEEILEELLSRPDEAVVETIKNLEGDIMFLGVAGKMGPTMARMAKRAIDAAGVDKKVIGVSRFSSPKVREDLDKHGIETIAGDLLERDFLENLPEVDNIIYMAARKFGASGEEWYAWAMNTYLPGMVAERFCNSRIVAFSTGNVYPFVPVSSGGPTEEHTPGPVGEYAQSCLGRERLFQYFSYKHDTPGVLIRLNYAVEMRYGVLLDIAQKVYQEIPIPLAMGYVNLIWQGDANRQTLRCFNHCESPPKIINLTGADIHPVRELAIKFGKKMGKQPILEGQESETALLSNPAQAVRLFGEPSVAIEKVMDWIVDWVQKGGETWNKPTKYDTRDGKF